ncbi:MAG: M28 family peptidase, partial [Solirubrobacteraceae bacterium]
LKEIVGVVNLDCIARGTTLEVMAGPEELRGRARAIVQALGLPQRYPVNVTPPQPGSDHVPFHEQGIPSVAITYYPYAEYHSPAEHPDLVDEVRLADAVDIAVALVKSQLETPAARERRPYF